MIQIVTDSTASIPAQFARDHKIDVLSLYVRVNEKDYLDAELDLDKFYKHINEMKDNPPKSSQPSAATMQEYFEAAARAGNAVVGVFMSSKMSGTFDGALRAAAAVGANRPSFQYALVDTLTNSYDEAFSVLAAAEARDAGKTCYQCARAAASAAGCSRFLFAPESLSFLRAGGRIGGAAALVGNLVKLTPVLTVEDGSAQTFAKVRTQKKAGAKIAEQLAADAQACELKNVVVHYIGSPAPAKKWAKNTIEPLVGKSVEVLPVSPVIGTHVGPAFGVAYECEHPLAGKFKKEKPEIVRSFAVKVKEPFTRAKNTIASTFQKTACAGLACGEEVVEKIKGVATDKLCDNSATGNMEDSASE